MSGPKSQPQHDGWNLTPLFWLSLAFLGGIVLGSSLSLTSGSWLWPGAALLVVLAISTLGSRFLSHSTAIFQGRISNVGNLSGRTWTKIAAFFSGFRFPAHPALLLAVAALGMARYQIAQPRLTPASLILYNDSPDAYVIEGIVVKPPDTRDMHTSLVVQVDRLRPVYDFNFTGVNGLLLAEVSPYKDWHYGDRIRLQGKLHTPPEEEGFSYRDYLARQGIYSLIQSPETMLLAPGMGHPVSRSIYAIRERAYDTIYALFPDPESSLFAGILLGMEGGIPAPVQDAFIKTGTSHIIAISGFNIAIISALLATIFGRILGRWRAAVATIIGITFYTLLVGADAAVVRAAILGGLSLLAAQLGRRQVGLNSLGIIAAVMALANPLFLWDLSFQLSFTATLGMVLYAEMLSERFKLFAARWLPQSMLQRITAPVSEYVLITLAAQVVTLPVIAYHFKRISLVSLFANPAILPAQPPLMILGGTATILGLILLPLGKIVAALAWPFALYTIRVVELFARIPRGEASLGNVSLSMVLLFYAALFTVTFAGEKVKGYLAKLKPGIPLAGLFVITILIWQMASTRPDSRLHLTLLNVSSNNRSGHAILIVTPTGRRVLVNGGPSTSLLSDALGRRLPWSDRKIDWLVVASTAQDELAALHGMIERIPPDDVLWAGATHGNTAARNMWEAFTLAQIPVTRAEAGHVLELGNGALLTVLHVTQRGAVLLLEWQNFRTLLPMGIDLDTIEDTRYGRTIGAVNVLLLAESGYAPVNPPDWITNLNPQLILLSVAAGDNQGLPSPETLRAIQDYDVLRTDRNGWIELTTDGEQMWVEVERK